MDLRELYQEIILDHGRHPRNFHALAKPSHLAHGHNPLCGDKVTVFLTLDGEVISDVSFVGKGCAISTASASLMTEIVKQKTLGEAGAIFKASTPKLQPERTSRCRKRSRMTANGSTLSRPREMRDACLARLPGGG